MLKNENNCLRAKTAVYFTWTKSTYAFLWQCNHHLPELMSKTGVCTKRDKIVPEAFMTNCCCVNRKLSFSFPPLTKSHVLPTANMWHQQFQNQVTAICFWCHWTDLSHWLLIFALMSVTNTVFSSFHQFTKQQGLFAKVPKMMYLANGCRLFICTLVMWWW